LLRALPQGATSASLRTIQWYSMSTVWVQYEHSTLTFGRHNGTV
jgi:hypothetical protein